MDHCPALLNGQSYFILTRSESQVRSISYPLLLYFQVKHAVVFPLARFDCYVQLEFNIQNAFYLAFSEESPCYEEHMDWKVIIDNYFEFFENFFKSPKASISRQVFRIQLSGLD